MTICCLLPLHSRRLFSFLFFFILHDYINKYIVTAWKFQKPDHLFYVRQMFFFCKLVVDEIGYYKLGYIFSFPLVNVCTLAHFVTVYREVEYMCMTSSSGIVAMVTAASVVHQCNHSVCCRSLLCCRSYGCPRLPYCILLPASMTLYHTRHKLTHLFEYLTKKKIVSLKVVLFCHLSSLHVYHCP